MLPQKKGLLSIYQHHYSHYFSKGSFVVSAVKCLHIEAHKCLELQPHQDFGLNQLHLELDHPNQSHNIVHLPKDIVSN